MSNLNNVTNINSRGSIQPVLGKTPPPVAFDPDNKHHRMVYAQFIQNMRWPDQTRFMVEFPHTSAITTIQTKLTQYALRKELKIIEASKVELEETAEMA